MLNTWKDAVATGLVAVVVVIYVGYLSFDGFPAATGSGINASPWPRRLHPSN
jgi:hypothetical protein